MVQENEKIEIKPIPIGDSKIRSKIRFEVVTARVIETGGKKHVVCESLIKLRGWQNLFFSTIFISYDNMFSDHYYEI